MGKISKNQSNITNGNRGYSFENINYNIAKIIFNFMKYSNDNKYDLSFFRHFREMKFIDLSFCEFDYILNDYDFRKQARNNLYLIDDALETENTILTADYIFESSFCIYLIN